MQADAFIEILQRSLDDEQLSRGEKKAIEQVLADEAANSDKLAEYRSQLFKQARLAMHDHRDAKLVDWLEKLNKLLLPDPGPQAPNTQVFFSPGRDCKNAILKAIDKSQHIVNICVFTITDNDIRNTIIQAHQRKVWVRIITDDEKSLDLGSDIEEMARAGIEVRYDKSPQHMHHKFAIFDQRSMLTGSFNWTRSASMYNQENLLLSDDPALVQPYKHEFEKLWEQFA